MAAPETGMKKPEMRKMLRMAAGDGFGCAVGVGESAAYGLFKLHRTKSGKAMEKLLKEDFPDAKSVRFGTASIREDEPKTVHLSLNRMAPGIAKKLIKTLKGTGFTQVVVNSEDGLSEGHEEEDEEPQVGDEEDAAAPADAPAAPEAEPVAAAPADGGVPPAPPPPPPQASGEDKAAQLAKLTRLLGELAGKVATVEDDARKAVLAKLAKDANVNLKTGNLQYAALGLQQLQKELAAASTAPAPAAPVALDALRVRWSGVRAEVATEVDTLRKALASTYEGQPVAAEIQSRFDGRTGPMLARLDERLDAALAEVESADAADRTGKVSAARSVLKDFLTYAMQDPFITDLDSNPFVPLSIRAKTTAALGAVGKALA